MQVQQRNSPSRGFDLTDDVMNRLLGLEASGWKSTILAETVACGDPVHAIYDVLR